MPQNWILRYYFIALIDVLGQSKKLLDLDRIPKTPEEKERASHILHETAGNINRLGNGFRTFYRTRNKPTGKLTCMIKQEISEWH